MDCEDLLLRVRELEDEKSKLCKILLEHRQWLREALYHLGMVLDAYNATSMDTGPTPPIVAAEAYRKQMEGF